MKRDRRRDRMLRKYDFSLDNCSFFLMALIFCRIWTLNPEVGLVGHVCDGVKSELGCVCARVCGRGREVG